jgi:hypothetical protein
MSNGDGIDLSRSTWQTPDGTALDPGAYGGQKRPPSAVPAVEACEAPGPGGWTCDLEPGHGPNHMADDGTAAGVRWFGPMAETTAIGAREPRYMPAYTQPEVIEAEIIVHPKSIAAIAEDALASGRPSDWAVALNEILGLCKD